MNGTPSIVAHPTVCPICGHRVKMELYDCCHDAYYLCRECGWRSEDF